MDMLMNTQTPQVCCCEKEAGLKSQIKHVADLLGLCFAMQNVTEYKSNYTINHQQLKK